MLPVIPTPPYTLRYKRAVLYTLTISVGLIPFMVSALTLALPEIGREFAADPVTLGWILTVYLLSASIFQIPIGNFADQTGRKCFFLKTGLLIFVLMSLLCAMVPTIRWMIGLRLIQGIGSAMVFGTNIAIISDVFAASERRAAFGINSGLIFLSLTSGPFIGGLLTHYCGWRSIFLFCVLWGVVGLILAQTVLRHERIHRPKPGVSQDYRGAFVYGVGLSLWICGLAGLPGTIGWTLLALCPIVLVGFVLVEQRHPNPMLHVRELAGNRLFCFSSLASLICYSATYAVSYVLSLYLKEIRGCDPGTAGWVLLTQSLAVALCSPVVGSVLSGRFSDRFLATSGISVNAIALAMLATIAPDTPLWIVVAILVLFGLGIALFVTPNTNAVMESVDAEHYGMASAMTGTVRMTGQATSTGLAMMLIATIFGRVQVTPQNQTLFLKSLHWILLIFAGLCVIGACASLARKKSR
ncbi:MAG: MFS transporter [Planctomycetia bacterium]|nr:MFS transporter [Planctomycetia bacterium]